MSCTKTYAKYSILQAQLVPKSARRVVNVANISNRTPFTI